MENVYTPDDSYCTENLDFQSYFQDYLNELLKLSNGNTITETFNLLTNADVNEKTLQMLEKVTSPKLLIAQEPVEGTSSQSCKVEILEEDEAVEEEEDDEDCGEQDASNTNSKKSKSNRFIKIKHEPSDTVIEQKPGTEFIVKVKIYFPYAYSFKSELKNRFTNLKASHEVVLLGSNTLADLRDKIACTNDVGYSINVDSQFTTNLKPNELYPSGFIFIDNVFYNDFRQKNAIDYSEVVRKWGIDKGMEFKTGLMDQTTIKDITPRLGYPYVYQHQGKCEHILIFTDARLTGIKDLNLTYPYYSGFYLSYGHNCDVCKENVANFICGKSKRLPHDVMYFCENCFYSYNYIDGKKIDNFVAYHYYDRSCIL